MCCRYPYRRDFRFDHIGTSLLTLFEVLTTEGWVDLRDMLNAPDGTSLNEGSSWVGVATLWPRPLTTPPL